MLDVADNDWFGGETRTLSGDRGANQIQGLEQSEIIDAGAGDDIVFGGGGRDTILGQGGNDTLVGNAQPFVAEADVLSGGEGDDLLYGENADTLNGGAGFDRLIAVNSFDFVLNMGATSIEYAVLDFGNDTADASTQTVGVSVFASGGADTLTGSNFADLLFGGVGNDVISGGDGADALVGEDGADQLNGGAGDDRIYFDAQDGFVFGGTGYDAGYVTSGPGVIVDLGARSLEFIQDLAGGNDTLLGSTLGQGFTAYAGAGADFADGSAYADSLWGEAGNDTLAGNAGDDVLVGGAGADVLTGGAGIDNLYGSAGSGGDGAADVFRFTDVGAADFDFVYDFESGLDKLDLSAFGASFAAVTLENDGGNARVLLNGQLVCIVAGLGGSLTASDFVFTASAPAEPELAPVAFDDGASPVVDGLEWAEEPAPFARAVSDEVWAGASAWRALALQPAFDGWHAVLA